MKTLALALACSVLPCLVAAQTQTQCDDIGMMGSRMVTSHTKAAGEAARDMVRKAGVDADLRAIRQRVLGDEFPKADVEVTLRKMLQAFCQLVWSDTGLSDEQKTGRVRLAEQAMLKPVEGPSELARTNTRIRSSARPDAGAPLRLAFGGMLTPTRWTAPGTVLAQAGAADEAFLRDPPAFVNDSNKYFVVVGSAASEKAAIQLMNRLKAKAPKYDFVVYLPYGASTHYAVMMATWVSKEVADKALRAARASVVPDAFLWACRSSGEGC